MVMKDKCDSLHQQLSYQSLIQPTLFFEKPVFRLQLWLYQSLANYKPKQRFAIVAQMIITHLKMSSLTNSVDLFIINNMAQVILTTILNKIRSISKECDIVILAEYNPNSESEINLEIYLKVLDLIRGQLIKYRQLEDQYYRLEAILQKTEADLRQKTGFEQQIKLYNDSLKTQFEELEAQKFQLLQNSKRTIKELKKVNQELFFKLSSNRNRNEQIQENKNEVKQGKGSKTDRIRSLAGKTTSNVGFLMKAKANKEDQLKQIVKTQYIERQQESGTTKNNMGVASLQFVEKGEDNNLLIADSSLKIRAGGKTDRQIIVSKKRQRNIYSNNNLLNIVRSNRRQQEKQLKDIYLPKSPEKKGESKKAKNKFKNLNRSLWKDKLANKSVNSITSMQPVVSNKETV